MGYEFMAQLMDPSLQWFIEVFWEGDAYAAIWNDDGGIYYRRYLVE